MPLVMISVSSCPARPTKGSPRRSSSRPGASPTKTSSALGLPTPNTKFVRPGCSLQRVQSPIAARSWGRSAAARTAAGVSRSKPSLIVGRVVPDDADPPRRGAGAAASLPPARRSGGRATSSARGAASISMPFSRHHSRRARNAMTISSSAWRSFIVTARSRNSSVVAPRGQE